MKATLNQVEAFCWIAHLGSYRAAARHLNLTQPTISLRVRAMEQALGIPLFERAGRRARPTTEAVRLLPQAEQILRLATELGGGQRSGEPLRGHLRLGAPDSFGLLCVPSLLRALKQRYPDLQIALTIDNSIALGRRLSAREIDLAFIAEPRVGALVRVQLLGAIEHAWAASPNLRLPRGTVQPGDLAPYDIFTNPEPSNLMTMVREWFATAGVEALRLNTCNSLPVILRLVAAGAGIGLLPTSMLSAERAAGTLRALRSRPAIVRSRLYGAWQLDKSGPAVRTVVELARQLAAKARLVVPA